ncbi:hypothetical protein [Pseudomonas parafulva]|uniref:hypothetical protein n=1 Tax=Pseudomonas parafulva TaxID=157782 RepID=UPI0012947B6D|nr:hypothetical protein [Pseudomonas parafulva]
MNRQIAFICTISALATSPIQSHAEAQASQSAQINSILETFEKSVKPDLNGKITLEKKINFQSNSYNSTNRAIGARYTYPQAFQIDEKKDLLYILRYSNGHPARGVIEKYKWSSGLLVSTYLIKEPQMSISEGIVVDHSDQGDLLYIRSENKLVRYQLIEGDNALGSTKKLKVLFDNVAQSFYRKDGQWYLEKYRTTPDAVGQSRGEYYILDRNFKHIGDLSLPARYAGYRESDQLNLPKHQGFAVLGDGYVMSMGGYWSEKTETTPYHYYGVNVFNSDGSIRSSSYVAPKVLFSELSRLGIKAYKNENEGIQAMNDGSLIALQVVQTKENPDGQLLFIRFTLPPS